MRVPVTFEPSGAVGWVEPGCTLVEAARSAGVTVPAPCGGRGVCGACGVRLMDGTVADPDDVELLGLRRAPAGVRLACRARVTSAVTVRAIVSYPSAPPSAVDPHGDIGMAVDLGTTNVAVAMVDLGSGREIARAVAPNRQASWGADVLSRVSAAASGEATALVIAAKESILEAVGATGVAPEGVVRVVLAGNTAMSALAAGAPVASLMGHPFTLPTLPARSSAHELFGSSFAPKAEVLLVPSLAGFVGGDITAGLVGMGLSSSRATVLLVDVGTNAEIALMHEGHLHVASAAAGPAFEGAGLSCGGPAVDGAVISVRAAGSHLAPDVLGETPPRWMGGSGSVSLLAALSRAGHLTVDGRMVTTGPLEERFRTDADGVMVVCPFEDSDHLCFSQLDVRALQLAKAAVRTGIELVMDAAKVDIADLDAVLVAGAFGGALEPDELVEIGMLPVGFAPLTRAVGNSSLQGAVAIALDVGLMEEARRVAAHASHVDLAVIPDFNERLISALAIQPRGV